MKVVATSLMLVLPLAAFCQLSLPELSPRSLLREKAGYTTVEVQYGRPAARGRKIMGALVPDGRLWRTGGGRCTTISFDKNVIIAGKEVPAGIYALTTIPGKRWTVMLNRDTSKVYGAPEEI